ncbi:hypothetical protein ABPG72_001181 [Tetrahymena utriculariae]
MTSKIAINNNILDQQGESLQQLIYEIKINTTIQESLIRFWKLFKQNYNGQIERVEFKKVIFCKVFQKVQSLTHFKKYVERILAFLLNIPDKSRIASLADDEISKFTTQNHKQHISYDIFCEFFANFAFKYIENVDIKSFRSFFDMVYDRTTKYVFKDVRENKSQQLDYDIKVFVYNREQIEGTFTEHQKNICPQNVVYVEEQVVLDSKKLEEKQKDEYTIIENQILTHEEIIPLGFSAENAINIIVNNKFEVPQGKHQHLPKKEIKNLERVKIIIESGKDILQNLQIVCKDSEVIQMVSCLCKHITKYVESPQIFNRINGYISHPLAYESLKDQAGVEQKFNVLSDFYSVDDLQIDQIHRINKKHQEANAQRRKLAEGENKKRNKKRPVDWEEYCRNLEYNMIEFIQNFIDQSKLKVSFRELKNQNQADIIGDTKLNLKDFVSQSGVIPVDTLNAYQDDVLEYANKRPLQIFVLGKPKNGKTKFCQGLAKKIDIVHIELSILIQNLFKRVQDNEENPQEVDGEVVDKLKPWERQILAELQEGKSISNQNLINLVNYELSFEEPSNKGYVLDLPLTFDQDQVNWVDCIIKNQVQLPRIGCRYFSHIIQFETSDDDIIKFASGIMEKDEEVIKVFSNQEREISRRPKRVPVEGEEEEEPVEEEDEEGKQPINDDDLVYRPNEDIEVLKIHLNQFEKVTLPRVKEFLQHLTKNEHLVIKHNGSNELEIVEYIYESLGNEVKPLRPLGVKLEGGSNKDLLTQGLEEQKLQRCWSPWQQIDPVELFKGRVVVGKSDYACDYAGRVFLFDNEQNQDAFSKNARKYLKKPPQLPKTYNVAIIGPRLSGKKTYGKKLAQEYGWKFVDVEGIIGEVLKWQRQQEIEQGTHVPSNFEARIKDIHLCLEEWKEFSKGNPLSAKEVWPIILHKLNIPLQKKPENWGVEKNENEEEEDEEAKRLAEEAAKKGKKAPKKKEVKEKPKEGEDERPKTPPPEDIPLKELIQVVQADNKLNPVLGICMIGQPTNEEEINKLKYHNIPIDKVVVLVDRNEEEEGRTLKTRPGFEYVCNIESELKFINDAAAVLKEQFGEENVKEISIEGSELEVYNRIKVQLDPFFLKCDEEENIARTSNDVQEGDDPVPLGEYGPFCPIAFNEEKWLLPGKKDFESFVRGKSHIFYSEEDKKKFTDHTWKYVDGKTHYDVPPPRIMIMGPKGSGVHTQLDLLQQKYKIPVFDLKKNLLAHILNEKEKRKQDRLFNRGFKPIELDEEGRPIEDQEINEEAQDFDKKAHEMTVIKHIFSDVQQCLINGNFSDVQEEVIQTPLNELLIESKKLPEFVLHLKVNEKSVVDRIFVEDDVKKEHRLQKEKEAEEARLQKLAELAEAGEEGGAAAAEQPPQEVDEEEEEAKRQADAQELQEKIENKKKELQDYREAEANRIEEYCQSFIGLGIPVVEINCDVPIQQVFYRINYQLKKYLEQRQNLLEKHQCLMLMRPKKTEEDNDEEEKPFRLDFFEKSYTFRKSRYQDQNALTLIDVPRLREYPLLYRDRIYYFGSEEELRMVAHEPLKYLTQKCFPKDVEIRPVVFVIGKPKTGKSALCKLLQEKLGLVRVKFSQILEEYIKDHMNVKAAEALAILENGQTLSDEQIVELVLQRIQQADCKANGWALDGLPQNRKQAVLFHQRGIIPSSVFSIQLSSVEIIERFKNRKGPKKFGYNDIVLHDKIYQSESDVLENYYLDTFNNIRFIDGNISKWGIFDQAKKFIHSSLLSKYQFTRAIVTSSPANVSEMSLTRAEILENIGKFKNYSPVSMKIQKKFVQNNIRHPYLAYYDGFLYILDNQKELNDFLNRPDLYVYQYSEKLNPPIKIQVDNVIAKYKDVSNQGHCVGTLRTNELKKSQPSLLVQYQDQIHSFSTADLMIKFITNPHDYINIKLHDKLPVQFYPTNLVKKVAKKGDCTAFLEHHLGNIVMRVLAQLGYKRIKYPTLSCKETALKFIAIQLKANNPNKDESYRLKYQQTLQQFLKHCQFCEQIRDEFRRKEEDSSHNLWNEWDEENLLKITKEFSDFKKALDQEEKEVYFQKYIH